MGKTFSMDISIDLMKSKLKDLLKKSGEQHYELISTVIIENLNESQVGLSQLYLAFSGFEEKINFLPGDEVIVKYKALNTWSINVPDMVAAGLIVNDMVKAVVVSVDPRKAYNVSIRYDKIESVGGQVKSYEQYVSSNMLKRYELSKITVPNLGDIV